MIKKIIFATLLSIAAIFPSSVNAQKGEAVFGVQTGYTSTNESAIAGLFFNYSLSNTIRLAPEIGCVFRHHDLDAFTFDLNVHFPLQIETNAVELYPLCGLDVSSWTHHLTDPSWTDDVTTRNTKIGANMGAGFKYNASPTLMFKIEGKYTLTSHYSTFVASIGIGYRF